MEDTTLIIKQLDILSGITDNMKRDLSDIRAQLTGIEKALDNLPGIYTAQTIEENNAYKERQLRYRRDDAAQRAIQLLSTSGLWDRQPGIINESMKLRTAIELSIVFESILEDLIK